MRGRIENILGEQAMEFADWPQRLLSVLDNDFSSMDALKGAYQKGALDSLYMIGDLRDEFERL